MKDNWPTYLFQYNHDGATWSFEIPAPSEQDAKARLTKLRDAEYVGVLQMKIPVELGVFARLVCWWQNRNRLNFLS